MNTDHWIKRSLAGLFLALILGTSFFFIFQREKAIRMELRDMAAWHEASYYEKLPNKTIQCFLCPSQCVLSAGQWGLCKARKNVQGTLYSAVYGHVATVHVDPIEKKPFFHVLPGSKAFSVATTGCNMSCLFCQNWEISQSFPGDIESKPATAAQIVDAALASGSESIAFTYNEPTIAFEYVLEIAKLAKSKGLKTLMVSSGYIEEKPLTELLKYIDAYKIDLKAFNEKFYKNLTGGHLKNILNTLKAIKQSGVWLEIVTLLVPGENDSEEELRALAHWIRTNLGADVPLHFSRFFPQYKLQNRPPTPPETLVLARKIAIEEGLKFVYIGNIANPEGEATYCPKSKKPAIIRKGNFVVVNNLKNGVCPDGEKIPGIWK